MAKKNKKLEKILSLYRKYIRYKNLYEEKSNNINPKLDQKWLDLYTTISVSEKNFYGFAFRHEIEDSPDYTGKTFSALRASEMGTGLVEVLIVKKIEKKSKSSDKIYNVFVIEDANSEEQIVNIFNDDYIRFSEELKEGNWIRISLDEPGKYKSYGLTRVQKDKFYKPVPKNQDVRIVLMAKKRDNCDA